MGNLGLPDSAQPVEVYNRVTDTPLAIDINGQIAVNSARIEPLGNVVEHFNGTATTVPATLNFAAYSKSILLHNTGSEGLLVSFDGGVNFKTLNSGISLAMEVRLNSMVVKAATTSTTYENLIIE